MNPSAFAQVSVIFCTFFVHTTDLQQPPLHWGQRSGVVHTGVWSGYAAMKGFTHRSIPSDVHQGMCPCFKQWHELGEHPPLQGPPQRTGFSCAAAPRYSGIAAV